MAHLQPTPKITTAGAVGAATLLIVSALDATGVDLGASGSTALGVVLTWLAGYLQRDQTSPPPRSDHTAPEAPS